MAKSNGGLRRGMGAGSRGPLRVGQLINPAHMKGPSLQTQGESPQLYKDK